MLNWCCEAGWWMKSWKWRKIEKKKRDWNGTCLVYGEPLLSIWVARPTPVKTQRSVRGWLTWVLRVVGREPLLGLTGLKPPVAKCGAPYTWRWLVGSRVGLVRSIAWHEFHKGSWGENTELCTPGIETCVKGRGLLVIAIRVSVPPSCVGLKTWWLIVLSLIDD